MTEAMPFLQNTILLYYDPGALRRGFYVCPNCQRAVIIFYLQV